MCPASFLSPSRMYCKGSSNEDYEKVALDNRLAYRPLAASLTTVVKVYVEDKQGVLVVQSSYVSKVRSRQSVKIW